MRNCLRLVCLLACTAAGAGEAPEEGWKHSLDLSLVDTGGNTDTTTFGVTQSTSWLRGRWTLAEKFAVVYGETGGEATTSTWLAGARGDYQKNKRLSFFGLFAFDRDTFAGIERRFEQAGGLTFTAWETQSDVLKLEGGLSLTEQKSTDDSDHTFLSLRTGAWYKHSFNDKSHFLQTLAFLPSLEEGDDWRLNSESALVAAMTSRLALKVSYLLRYDHLPEPGFETTDRTFLTALQVTF